MSDIRIRNVLLHLYAYVTRENNNVLMCYVCVQLAYKLYAYVICGKISVKLPFDMYEPYTYVTTDHYMKYRNDYYSRFVS